MQKSLTLAQPYVSSQPKSSNMIESQNNVKIKVISMGNNVLCVVNMYKIAKNNSTKALWKYCYIILNQIKTSTLTMNSIYPHSTQNKPTNPYTKLETSCFNHPLFFVL